MNKAYYNEIDSKKAAWLRELIKAGLIAPGEVDERDIQDVLPSELTGFTQCHFFAGIGIWSHALRQAGWPDDRPVWTGSCPCQPFSAAGQRKGFDDERHLWPSWFWLIQQCRPDAVFGEQVSDKGGKAWLDLVQADLEANSYAFGAIGLCAAGFGAPHIRHRFYFVADSAEQRCIGRRAGKKDARQVESERLRDVSGLADPELSERGQVDRTRRRIQRKNGISPGEEGSGRPASNGKNGSLGNTDGERREEYPLLREGQEIHIEASRPSASGWMGNSTGQRSLSGPYGRIRSTEEGDGSRNAEPERPGPVNGFWADAEWIYHRDEFYRPVRPGSFPLAHGASARVVRLSGYGDGIVAPVAREFIQAYLEISQD